MASPLTEASRRFTLELMNMINRRVKVVTTMGTVYEGVLLGVDNDLNIVLADVSTSRQEKYPRVVLLRHAICEIALLEERLDLRELAKLLEKYFPGMVKYVEEANIILVGDRIRVTEAGVEGSGPLAKRVKEIFDQFMMSRGK